MFFFKLLNVVYIIVVCFLFLSRLQRCKILLTRVFIYIRIPAFPFNSTSLTVIFQHLIYLKNQHLFQLLTNTHCTNLLTKTNHLLTKNYLLFILTYEFIGYRCIFCWQRYRLLPLHKCTLVPLTLLLFNFLPLCLQISIIIRTFAQKLTATNHETKANNIVILGCHAVC